MSKLLFLSHRIPYPPDKGDKIRAWHLLRHLARGHEVHLGSFVDDSRDWAHRHVLEGICASVELIGLAPRRRRLRSLSSLMTGEALSLGYYRFAGMQDWVDRTVAERGITHAVVFSSTMAQYVASARHAALRRVADFCDVDSDKWRQYAQRKRWPARAIFAREADRLLDFERRIAATFDATLFVSPAEAALFRSLAPGAASVGYFENGVDTDYFDPGLPAATPYDGGAAPSVVFTGAMDYWANVDAVAWFARSVWPQVRAQVPDAGFWIVGSNPTPEVRALGELPGVHVTGRVPDTRPYLAHANVAVAPLRIARGVQNKVLEALAMAQPVVCTPAAAEGLRLPDIPGFRVAGEPADFSAAVVELMRFGSNREGRHAVVSRYGWEANLAPIDALLRG